MQEHEILMAQGFEGGLYFSLVVGVGQPRCARHLDDVQPGVVPNAPDEVNRTDNAARADCREHVREG